MDDLTAEEKEILQLFDAASRLKDVARKSLDQIDVYLEAAAHFHRAAELSDQMAGSADNELDDKIQHLVFGQYYAYEEHHCLGAHYYEKHDTRNSAKHHKLAADHLEKALTFIENLPSDISPETKSHLESFLPNWRHSKFDLEIKLLTNDARAAWDSGRFIDALDIYRLMADRQREYIDNSEFKTILPQYQRIAIGNYIGSMANASSALANIVLDRGKGIDRGGKELTRDLLIKLVKYTLDSYRLGNAAFDQNPEWDQYRLISQQAVRSIENFLKGNPSARVPLAIAFEDDPDFIKILKMTEEGKGNRKKDLIKILLLSANPDKRNILQLDEEVRAITQKVRAAERRDLIQIVTAGAVRPDDLLQVMNEHRPHVVQFSGHGSDSDEIILCDANGRPKPVGKDALVALFESTRNNVRVVVLNSCYSKAQAEAIVSVVPCAIGMNDTIGDRAALIFAASFYRAVAFGHSVETSFQQGIAAMKLEGVGQDQIPELITGEDINPSEIFIVESKDG